MMHLTPRETWQFVQAHPQALFLDVRMEIEYLYVGHPPGVVHVAWYEYPNMHIDPLDFVARVRHEGGQPGRPAVLMCRSGNRSQQAGQALMDAGFDRVVNVLHGFEGDLDAHFRRGRLNGWRFDGLPWEQL